MSERMSYPVNPSEAERKEAQTPTEIKIHSGNTEVVVAPDKGGLVSVFAVDGENILYEAPEEFKNQKNMKPKAGIPLLFPYAGPMEGGIQHGGGREVPMWEWQDQTENSVTISLDSENIAKLNWPPFPAESTSLDYEGKDAKGNDILEALKGLYGEGYKFHVDIKITVNEGSLRYDFKITNQSDKEMPFAPGLHPYFKADHNKQSEIQNNLGVDLSKRKWPDFIPANRPENGVAEFTLPDGKTVSVESSDSFQQFVFWSNSLEDDYICVEPFTTLPNKPEGNMLIKPNESEEVFVKFSIK